MGVKQMNDKIKDLEKKIDQSLENNIEIMSFLNGLRTTIINLSSNKDAKEIEDMPWFGEGIEKTRKLLEDEE